MTDDADKAEHERFDATLAFMREKDVLYRTLFGVNPNLLPPPVLRAWMRAQEAEERMNRSLPETKT